MFPSINRFGPELGNFQFVSWGLAILALLSGLLLATRVQQSLSGAVLGTKKEPAEEEGSRATWPRKRFPPLSIWWHLALFIP